MNILDLSSQFELQIKDQENLFRLWKGFHVILLNPNIDHQGQAYQIFSTALQITRIVAKSEMINLWMELLKQATFNVSEKDKLIRHYNFDSIVTLSLKGEDNFKIDLFVADKDKNDIQSLANDVDSIAKEALGSSPGVDFFKNMLNTPHNLCLFAQHEDIKVGCLYGGYTQIKKEDNDINVFHFRFIGRKADYPSINFIQLMQDNEKLIYDKFPDLDYLSLCVVVDNHHALEHYQKLGFSSIKQIEKGFLGKDTIHMMKKVNENNFEAPSLDEINQASKKT